MNSLSWARKLFKQDRNSKLRFYLRGYTRNHYPDFLNQHHLRKILTGIDNLDKEEISARVNYYNRIVAPVSLSTTCKSISELKELPKKRKNYFIDLYEYTRFLPANKLLNLVPGDVTTIPEQAGLVKSRPINENNQNAVLLKLNKVRHFNFVDDELSLDQKEDRVVWRGKLWSHQQDRNLCLQKYFDHSLFDLGKVNQTNDATDKWLKTYLSIKYQLKNKFVFSLEGNDVATNLKWIMSSNSVAVMPKPKFETWFMEGSLKPDFHYIEVSEDFSDVESKLHYYINNLDELNEIRKNAHTHVQRFENEQQEDVISLLVLLKYLSKTDQIDGDILKNKSLKKLLDHFGEACDIQY